MKYPGLAACLLFAIGIMLGTVIHPPDFITFCLCLVISVLALFALVRKSRRWALVAAACCLIVLGMFRFNLLTTNLPQNHISWFNDLSGELTVTGRIIGEPDLRPDKTHLTVSCDTVILRDRKLPTSGLLLVSISRFDDRFNYADRVEATGHVRSPAGKRNFHGFDYRRYLRLKQINSRVSVGQRSAVRVVQHGSDRSLLSTIVIPIRKHILNVFEEHLRGSEKSLIAGFLIGETRFIPQDIYDRFKDTGTLHLLAVSGSNVALVLLTAMLLFRVVGVPRRLVEMLSLGVILLFCQLSFNQPSVVRASLMIGLVIVGRLIYRKGSLLNIMAVAALLILLYDPMMLYDVGFQLSFAAAFSLIYFLKGIMPKQRRYPRWKRWVKDYGWMIVLSSIVVQLTVAPILAYYFGTIPMITFASNLIVIPLSSAAVISSLLLIVFAQIPVLADVIAIATQFFLHLSVRAVDLFASLPVARLEIATPATVHIVFYCAALFAFFATVRRRRNLRNLILVLLVWGNVFVWKHVIDRFDEKPVLTLIDLEGKAGLHLHLPPDYDAVLTNATHESGYSQIDRVLAPYFAGERIDDLEMWEICAPSDGIDTAEFIHLSPVPIVPSDPPSNGAKYGGFANSIEIFESLDGIEMARFRLGGQDIVWLSDWDMLQRHRSRIPDGTRILALPHPYSPISQFFDQIRRIGPDLVAVYSYSVYEDRSDLDFVERELEMMGISLVDTRNHGAIRFCFSQKGYDLIYSIPD